MNLINENVRFWSVKIQLLLNSDGTEFEKNKSFWGIEKLSQDQHVQSVKNQDNGQNHSDSGRHSMTHLKFQTSGLIALALNTFKLINGKTWSVRCDMSRDTSW